MAWLFNAFTEKLQKRFTRFVLNKTIGQFLNEKLHMDQIEFRAMAGEFCLKDLELGAQAIGALLPDIPFRVVEGSVEEISGVMPYKNVLSEGCEILIKGVDIVLEPREPAQPVSHSVVDAADVSIQTTTAEKSGSQSEAEKADDGAEEGEDFWKSSEERADDAGLQSLNYLIDSIIARVSVTLESIRITLRHRTGSQPQFLSGVVISVARAKYTDETQLTAPAGKDFNPVMSPVATKNITFEGVSVAVLGLDGLSIPILHTGTESHMLHLTLRKVLTSGQDKVEEEVEERRILLDELFMSALMLQIDVNFVLQQLSVTLEPRILASMLELLNAFTSANAACCGKGAAAQPAAEEPTSIRVQATVKSGNFKVLLDALDLAALDAIIQPSESSLLPHDRDHISASFANFGLTFHQGSGMAAPAISFSLGSLTVLEAMVADGLTSPLTYPLLDFEPPSGTPAVSGKYQVFEKERGNQLSLVLSLCRAQFDVSLLDRLCFYLAIPTSEPTLEDSSPPTTVVISSDCCDISVLIPVPSFSARSQLVRPAKPALHDVALGLQILGLSLSILPTSAASSSFSLPLSSLDTMRLRIDLASADVSLLHAAGEPEWIGAITNANTDALSSIVLAMRKEPRELAAGLGVAPQVPPPFRDDGPALFCLPHRNMEDTVASAIPFSEMVLSLALQDVQLSLSQSQYSTLMTYVLHLSMFEPFDLMGALFGQQEDPERSTSAHKLTPHPGDDDESDDDESARPTPASLSTTPQPSTIRQLRHFLSFIGNFRSLDMLIIGGPEDMSHRAKVEDLRVAVLQGVHLEQRQDVAIAAASLELSEVSPGVPDTLILHTTSRLSSASTENGFSAVQVMVSLVLNKAMNLKTMSVVCDIRTAFLSHAMKPGGQNWLLKLIAFTDFPDPKYPIVSPSKMVRLHVHFRDLQIAYNPTRLAVCSLISSKHAYVCSNIVPLAALSTLTFKFDETSMFLAENAKSISLFQHGSAPCDSGYAMVMHDPSLSVELQLCSDTKRPPEVNVLIGNEELEVDVCSDSLSSLIAIFQHYFTDGDLQIPTPPPTPCTQGLPQPVPVPTPAGMDTDESMFYSAVGHETEKMDVAAHHQGYAEAISDAMADESPQRTPAMLATEEDYFFDTQEDYFEPEQTCRLCHRGALASGLCKYHEEISQVSQTRTNSSLLQEALNHSSSHSTSLSSSPHSDRLATSGSEEPIPYEPDFESDSEEGSPTVTTPVPRTTARDSRSSMMQTTSIPPTSYGMPKKLVDKPSKIINDYFQAPIRRVTDELYSSIFPDPVVRVAVHDANVRVKLHSGTDWHSLTADDFLERQEECIELVFTHLGVCFEVYGSNSLHSSRLSLVARDFMVVDQVEKSAMNMFLNCYNTDEHPRETDESMGRLDLIFVRTPGTMDEEIMLRLALLPLRLNLDQDTLDFLVTFFALMQTYEQRLAESFPSQVAPATPPYIKFCVVSPIIAKIDYDPKHLAISSLLRGDISEVAGLLSLRQATLSLPPVFLKGLQGFDVLAKAVVHEWLSSYSDKLPGLITGMPVVRPVSNVVVAGVKLLHQPFATYPRVLQGIRQGFVGGFTTTTVEFCNVTTALLFATQAALEAAQALVSAPSGGLEPRRRFTQPVDAQTGLRTAASVLQEGLSRWWRRWTPTNNQSRGVLRTVAGAVADLPAASLQPLIAVCESVSVALQGFRNSLHPDTRRDLQAKYRTR